MSEKQSPVTVKDVAEKAGVSTATVSRVLNGDLKVRPDTAEKVQKAVSLLGYRMNQVARSLKTRRTHTIGIIAPEFRNDFFMSIVTGIEDTLKQIDFSVILCSSRENLKEEENRLRLLKEKNVDGVIIIPGSNRGEHFQIMEETPIVLVDRLVEGFESDAVLSDNFQGSYEAVKYSLKRGARRIGFIGGDRTLTSAKERFDGYLKALEDFQREAESEIILFGDYHEDSGYHLMKTLMELESPPDHVFISNYFMHLGAARYLLQSEHKGLHILSFDDLPLASFFPYTSIIVAQPMEEIGRQAAELLIQRINGSKAKKMVLRLPTTMRILE
ncbi:LacI family DNA-binding transcriptional regulator [Oceanispirochaeta sp.]|jgi:LacI family transcriptional regulator|uniref:LacI family DNA-binding transcriptional regulator n=1 Tax=Oceanispirochaeta sp. TaxID=2035350 RepID=UPI00260FDB4A|nr:LacI family DNA-binding transcriptional regulator [Oceanispirochaeta sp.]MDA3956347.1 LacI family DNA-binding transcriptional regulator [Oceanispirochaeta sp.]